MNPISKRIVVNLIVVGAVGSLGACSTVDRLRSNDQSVYAGTRASTAASDMNPVDTVFSAIGDTILLPYTGIRYLFGYRYEQPSSSGAAGSPTPRSSAAR